MARKRKNPASKRNQTTRRGRREGPDRGPAKLRRDRLNATGREDLPDDPLGILYGQGHISLAGYNCGRDISELLATVSLAFGNGGSVQGTWLAIVSGGAIRGPAADVTWRAVRALRLLAKLEDVIGDKRAVEEVFQVCAGTWPRWAINPQKIDHALDRMARYWSAS